MTGARTVPVAVGLVLGILVADQLRPTAIEAVLVGFAGVVLLAGAYIRHRRSGAPEAEGDLLPSLAPLAIPLLILGMAAVGFSDFGLRELARSPNLVSELEGRVVRVSGRVADDPKPGKVTRFLLRSDKIDGRTAHLKLAIASYARTSELLLGDQIQFEAKIARLDENDEFDSRLARRSVAAEATVAGTLRKLGPSPNPFIRASNHFRRRMTEAAERAAGGSRAGLLLGVVIGDESKISDGVKDDFRASGLSHLTAVSGANVAMVLGFIMVVLSAMGIGRRGRIAGGLFAIAMFAIITRWEPSVLRAAVMASIALAAFLFGRRATAIHGLGVAFIALVAIDPNSLWSVGFQLSFAATAGILLIGPLMLERLQRLPNLLAQALAVGASAQMAVFPLLAVHFGRLSLVALPANLLAFALVAPATVIGFAGGLVSLVSITAAAIVMKPASLCALILEKIAHLFGGSRLAQVHVPNFGAAAVVSAYLAIAAIVLLWGRRPRWARWPAAVAALVFVFTALVPIATSAAPPGMRITFFDVGQGDAALVEDPSGARILIDGGPDPSLLARTLARRGYDRIDVVVFSHAHFDHVNGLFEVIDRFGVRVALHPGVDDPLLRRAGTLQATSDGDAMSVGGITLQTLGPSASLQETAAIGLDLHQPGEGTGLNNASVVLRVSYGSGCALFTGDLEEAGQEALLEAHPGVIDCTILKAPHHGSARLVGAFVDAVDPEWVPVSVGPNEYGHPTKTALDVFERAGARVLRTDRLGDIVLLMDSRGIVKGS